MFKAPTCRNKDEAFPGFRTIKHLEEMGAQYGTINDCKLSCVTIILLEATVALIGNINIAFAIHHNIPGIVKLPWHCPLNWLSNRYCLLLWRQTIFIWLWFGNVSGTSTPTPDS